jgi:tRNA pseudouridine(55) synthase
MSRSQRKRKRLRKYSFYKKSMLWIHTQRNRMCYPKYLTTMKYVGETPLIATQRLQKEHALPTSLPLSYAGRLDPMASGKLLILVGDECKKQKKYHTLDKEYTVEMLLGISSDSGDILGVVKKCTQKIIKDDEIYRVYNTLIGDIDLPYPHFSSKTVQGKPLHIWALENRLDEIEIPIKISRIYAIRVDNIRIASAKEIYTAVRTKIETIPMVTDPRKHLGSDFRRNDVRNSWMHTLANDTSQYHIITFTCIASSGTYMRSLCEYIAHALGTCGLAYAIHRTTIGKYVPIYAQYGLWRKKYT